MLGIRGFPAKTAILLAFGACSTPPKVTPASDYREAWQTARASFARANSLLHEGLLGLSASDLKALVDAEDRLGKETLEELRAITE